jgi:Na+-transporting NADH:ubiquinone oxidoreductase subunit NqrC
MAEIKLPPVLTIKRDNFEKAFKILMTEMISDSKITVEEIREVNKQLVKWLITGMQNVDFEKDRQNQYNLDRLVDDLWTDFYRSLNMKVRKYRIKFRRK